MKKDKTLVYLRNLLMLALSIDILYIRTQVSAVGSHYSYSGMGLLAIAETMVLLFLVYFAWYRGKS